MPPCPDDPANSPAPDAGVRPARPRDLPAVGRIQAATWRQAYANVLPSDLLDRLEPAGFERSWRASLAEPPSRRHHLLVATAGAHVVGFTAVGPSQDADAEADDGEVLVLAVDPARRGQGHGSRLLNAASDTLRGDGFGQVRLWLGVGDEDTRAFLGRSGLAPDGAFRDRVVDAAGGTARQVRLVAELPPR